MSLEIAYLKKTKGMKGFLLTLLVHGELSENQIHKRMEKEKVSRTQILKLVKKLEKSGLIEVTPGKRDAKISDLTTKGLAYLIFHTDLTDQDFEKTFRRFYYKKYPEIFVEQQSVLIDMSITSCREFVETIKPKINLEFFDKEWLEQLFLDSLLDKAWAKISELKHRKPLPPKSKNAALKGLKRNKEDLEFLKNYQQHLKHEQKQVTNRIAFIDKMLTLTSN